MAPCDVRHRGGRGGRDAGRAGPQPVRSLLTTVEPLGYVATLSAAALVVLVVSIDHPSHAARVAVRGRRAHAVGVRRAAGHPAARRRRHLDPRPHRVALLRTRLHPAVDRCRRVGRPEPAHSSPDGHGRRCPPVPDAVCRALAPRGRAGDGRLVAAPARPRVLRAVPGWRPGAADAERAPVRQPADPPPSGGADARRLRARARRRRCAPGPVPARPGRGVPAHRPHVPDRTRLHRTRERVEPVAGASHDLRPAHHRRVVSLDSSR